jgi:uncharacterized membrane protein YvlD (DUF360 family)
MRKKASVLLLVVFAIFLGIVIFHPLSHGVHHDNDDGHECSVCLWINHVVIALFFSIILSVLFRVILRLFVLPHTPLFEGIFSTSISRAPPQVYP